LILGIRSISLILTLALATTFRLRTHEIIWKDYGETPEEARSRGCSFDMLSHAWQTKECYDEEISESYRQAGAWEPWRTSTETEIYGEKENAGFTCKLPGLGQP
jgi:hypothetical protein